MAEPNAESERPRGYDRLINVAAGSVTVVAGTLGALGVTASVATALLRNAPAATLTATCLGGLGGLGVLMGIVSAFVPSDATLDDHLRWTRAVRISP